MAPSPIVAATLQSVFLAAVSNILAQAIAAYRHKEALAIIDWVPVFQFLVFTLVSTPPNFLWQEFLESTFPAHPEPQARRAESAAAPPPPPRLSVRNTAVKMLLDQTVAAAANTLLFTTFVRSLRAAMHPAPRITSLASAANYWSSPGTIDFARVHFPTVWAKSLGEFWPIMAAGAKFWPFVSFVNFTLVKSVQGRNLVGGLAGVAWGVYICLATAS